MVRGTKKAREAFIDHSTYKWKTTWNKQTDRQQRNVVDWSTVVHCIYCTRKSDRLLFLFFSRTELKCLSELFTRKSFEEQNEQQTDWAKKEQKRHSNGQDRLIHSSVVGLFLNPHSLSNSYRWSTFSCWWSSEELICVFYYLNWTVTRWA